MMTVLRVALITVLSCLSGVGNAFVPGRGGEWDPGVPTVPLLPSGKAPAPPPLRSGFLNGSFDAVSGPLGQPVGWNIYRGGSPTSAPGRGEAGSRAARIGGQTGYWQQFTMDVGLFQTVTFAGWGRGELGVEQIRVVMEAYTADVRYLRGIGPARSAALPTDGWGATYLSFTRSRPDEARLSVLLIARADTDWLDVDDARLLREGFRDGLLAGPSATEREAGWALADGATIGRGRLFLPAGASARQAVAESPLGKDYFIYVAADGEPRVRISRLGSAGEVLGAVEATPGELSSDADGGRVYPVPPGKGASAAEVELSSGSGEVTIRAVSRGFVQAWPDRLLATPGSPMPSVRLAAAWPDLLESATLTIVDGDGASVATPMLLQDRDSVWTEFDGGELPAGRYRARFRLETAEGRSVAVAETAFTIERPEPFAASPRPFESEEFVRMPWVWMYPFNPELVVETAEEAEAILRPVRDDGFNFFLIITSTDQLPVVQEGARRVGVPYAIYDPRVTEALLTPDNQTWHPDLYVEALEPLLPLSNDPLFRGVYLRDEPNILGGGQPREFLERIQRAMLLLERDGRFGTPLSFLSTNPRNPMDIADFPVMSTYMYPVQRRAQTNRERFVYRDPRLSGYLSYLQETEPDVARARELGKPFWAGVQGYGSIVADPAMSPAQASAQLGLTLALGVEGYFTFEYNTLAWGSGLRSRNGDPSPRIAVYQDFNRRVEALWPLLRTLTKERTAPPQEGVAARVAPDPNGVPHAVVVNYEEIPLTVEVETSGTATMTNVEGGTAGSASQRHTLALGPGGWAVVRFDGADPVRFTGRTEAVPAERLAPVAETARLATGAVSTRLTLNPGRGNFATVAAERFRVFTNDGASVLDVPTGGGAAAVRFLGPDRLLTATQRLGFRIYDLPTTTTAVLAQERLRFTGGALDLMPLADNRAWIAMAYRGTGLANLENGGFRLEALLPAPNSDFVSLHGPYAGDAIVALEQTWGPLRAEPQAGIVPLDRFDTSQVYARGSTSPGGGRIATGNVDRGATVYHVGPDGRREGRTRITDPALVQAEGTAWLSDDTLAVTDLHRGIRFYRVRRGEYAPLGVWKPTPEPFQIEALDALPGGRLAVALSDGTIVFADTAAVVSAGRASGWVVE